MTRLLRFTVVLALLAPLSLVAGCKQGRGERCQVASDCDDGLNCIIRSGSTPQAGGTCQPPGTTETADLAAPIIPDFASTPPTD
jgi:hypothetical protein